MRDYQFKKEYNQLLSPEIVMLLSQIHEFKGKQDFMADANVDVLAQLVEVAKIQSTDASNRIEGIITTDERLSQIVKEKTMPKNRNEQEIAGYRDVLTIIHESYDYIPPKPNVILQLHRDLYKFSGQSIGGSYKNSDNFIAKSLPDSTKTVGFEPVSAWETPDSIQALCDAFEIALSDMEMDALILIPMFVLDFLCIHPFQDGNGRMSRLLTLLLLYRAGYRIGKYISIEQIIADSKETYYEALQESSFGWHENKNDYTAFVRYFLGVLVAAYREFETRVSWISNTELSKPEKVREAIQNHLGQISKAEIMHQCPGVSQVTVQRALADLLKNNEIIKIGGGRYTKYVWNHEKE